jgi:hypothetical protein
MRRSASLFRRGAPLIRGSIVLYQVPAQRCTLHRIRDTVLISPQRFEFSPCITAIF